MSDHSEYVREQGKHELFHKIIFQKFYGEGQNLRSWSVLRAAAEEVGVDADEMEERTENGRYTKIIDQRLAELQNLGASGVPLYIFDGKYAVIGLQPYAAFEEVMAHIIQT